MADNGTLVRDDSGDLIPFPFCDPMFCSEDFLSSLDEDTRNWFEEVFDCQRIGDTFTESDNDIDCYSPYSQYCNDPPVVSVNQNYGPLDVAAARASIKMENSGACPGFFLLMSEALAMLRVNLDLVEYMCCLLFGPDGPLSFGSNPYDCLEDAILNEVLNINISDLELTNGFSCSAANSSVYEDLQEDYHPEWFTVFEWACNPEAGTVCKGQSPYTGADYIDNLTQGDENGAMCGVIFWAGVMIHEMMHSCMTQAATQHGDSPWTYGWLGALGTEDQQADCDLIHLVNNSPFLATDITRLLMERYGVGPC